MATIVNDRSLSGNDISVYLSLQTTKGEIDANPVFDPFRRTEGKPRQEITYVQSEEVKTNRQGRIQVQDASTFTGELSYEVNQTTAKYLDATIHGEATDNSILASTDIGATATGFFSGAAVFTNLSEGDWFYISGFTDSSNDGYYKISQKLSDSEIYT